MARAADEIIIGEVVRRTEPDLDLLECFNPEIDQCVVSKVCNLKYVLFEAKDAFLGVLDKYTLADAAKAGMKTSPEFKSIPVVHN